MSQLIQVSLVEDDAGVRGELQALLNAATGFHCLAAYPDAETALAWLPGHPPDLVLVDVNLPGLSGIECVHQLKEVCPTLPMVMLTIHDDRENFLAAVAAGANAYLLKRSPRVKLLEALREVWVGGVPVNARAARWIVECFQEAGQAPHAGGAVLARPTLMPDEEELLARFAQGHTVREIVAMLGLSDDRVRGQLLCIHEKLRHLLRLGLAGGPA